MGAYLEVAASLGRRTRRCIARLPPPPTMPRSRRSRSRATTAPARSAARLALAERTLRDARDRRSAPDAQAGRRTSARGSDSLLDRRDGAAVRDGARDAAGTRRVCEDPHPRRLPPGQVLLAEGDFYIPTSRASRRGRRAARREKQSPLKDVASMLRSFSYAAYAALLADARRDRPTSAPARTVGAHVGNLDDGRVPAAAISTALDAPASCRPTSRSATRCCASSCSIRRSTSSTAS